jgi:ABC-type antimicrobial peptide transport system permease subunit
MKSGARYVRSRLLAKSLKGRRLRVWLAIAGVAACSTLVITIASAYRNVRSALSDYAGQPAVDLWVAPAGADNLIRGSFGSYVHLADANAIRAIPGVAKADPIQVGFLAVKPLGSTGPERRLTLLSIGYHPPDGLGGAPLYAVGRPPRAVDEIALDRAAAFRLGVRLGDSVDFNGYPALVVGLTKGTNILASQFVFADFEAVASGATEVGDLPIRHLRGAAFVLVKLLPGAQRDVVIRAIEERFPNLRAYTREQFVTANDRELSAGFVPLLALATLLAIGAAALLVGLLILSVVDERRGDIAVLLALGTGAGAVGRGVLAQAAVLSLEGTGIGAVVSYALYLALDAGLPTIPLRMSLRDVVATAVLFLVTGLLGAIAPVVRLNAVDPLEAFRP